MQVRTDGGASRGRVRFHGKHAVAGGAPYGPPAARAGTVQRRES
jgi:hypothetical protein